MDTERQEKSVGNENSQPVVNFSQVDLLKDVPSFSKDPLLNIMGLDQVQTACLKFAEVLVRLDEAQVSHDDERYVFMKNLLHHAISRKREMMSHFPSNISLPGGIANEKRSILSSDQRVQLVTQIHAVRFLIQRSDDIRHGRPAQPFPIVVQHSIGAFNFAIQLREGKITSLNPTQKAQIQAALSTATRLASRVVDPASLLIETLGMHYIPQPLRREVVLNERERLMDMQIRERISHLESLMNPSRAEEIELKSLKLRGLQKRVRDKINDAVLWDEIIAGGFNGSKEEILALREAKRRKKELKIRRDELKLWTNHASKLKNNYLELRNKSRIICESLLHLFRNRSNQKTEQERTSQRLQNQELKEQDIEASSNLVLNAKEERYLELFSKTKRYLLESTKSISQHKRITKKNVKGLEKIVQNSEIEEGKDLENFEKIYESVTWALHNESDEQPKLKGKNLRDFQISGFKWLVSLHESKLNGILADEAGLGKVAQTVAFFAYLLEQLNGPFLIVTTSYSIQNWLSEFEAHLPSAIVKAYDGNRVGNNYIQAQHIRSQRYNILLTTGDIFLKEKNHLAYIEWDYIVIDEADRLKNNLSKLTPALNDSYVTKSRLALVGTPLPDNLQDLWSYVRFLYPEILEHSDNFYEWLSMPLYDSGLCSDQGIVLSEEDNSTLANYLLIALRPFYLRRLKKDVLIRPPTNDERIVECQSSDLQAFMYNSIVSNEVALNYRPFQLRKVCNHPFLFHPYFQGASGYSFPIDDSLIRASGKLLVLDVILAKLRASGHRVLLNFNMLKMLDLMCVYLDYRGYSFKKLDGASNLDNDSLEGEEVFIFMGSTKGGEVHGNVPADTIIMFDSDWNPQNDTLAQVRAQLLPGSQETLVIRLVTNNSIEQQAMQRAMGKEDTDSILVKCLEKSDYESGGASSEGDLQEETLILDELSAKEQLNLSLARSDEELSVFEKFDADVESHKPLELLRIEETPTWVMQWWEISTKRRFDYSRLAAGQKIRILNNPLPIEALENDDAVEKFDLKKEQAPKIVQAVVPAQNAVTKKVLFKFSKEVNVVVKFEGEVVHPELLAQVSEVVETTGLVKQPSVRAATDMEDSD